jgi:hypothetical protein
MNMINSKQKRQANKAFCVRAAVTEEGVERLDIVGMLLLAQQSTAIWVGRIKDIANEENGRK